MQRSQRDEDVLQLRRLGAVADERHQRLPARTAAFRARVGYLQAGSARDQHVLQDGGSAPAPMNATSACRCALRFRARVGRLQTQWRRALCAEWAQVTKRASETGASGRASNMLHYSCSSSAVQDREAGKRCRKASRPVRYAGVQRRSSRGYLKTAPSIRSQRRSSRASWCRADICGPPAPRPALRARLCAPACRRPRAPRWPRRAARRAASPAAPLSAAPVGPPAQQVRVG
jgi:hypothetical protein